jgi:hypothetical protein
MKKYLLIAAISLTALFAATEMELTPGEVEIVRALTGYSLLDVKSEVDAYLQPNSAKYQSDGKNVSIIVYKDHPYRLEARFTELFDVTMRFYAKVVGKLDTDGNVMADDIRALNIFEKLKRRVCTLIVYSASGIPRVARVGSSTHSKEISELCTSLFGVVPTFTEMLSARPAKVTLMDIMG